MIGRTIRGATCDIIRCMQILSRVPVERKCSRQYSTNVDKIPYDNSQVQKVLRVLNECTACGLKELKIGPLKCEKIVYFRTANGEFESLTDVLKVDGVGLKSLIEICDCILHSEGRGKKSAKTGSTQSQWIVPNLLESNKQSVETVVGLHVTNHVVSWAKLTRDNYLVNWDLINLPEQVKRPHPVNIFQMTLDVIHELPSADLYVMEDLFRSGPQTLAKTSALFANVQLWQFRAMLQMWLNTRKNPGNEERYAHTVYFLRPHLAARLFNALVGTESISLENIVEDILAQKNSELPERCAPIFVDQVLCNHYFSKINFDKENMGHALLLTIAFLNLIIHRKNESIKYVVD